MGKQNIDLPAWLAVLLGLVVFGLGSVVSVLIGNLSLKTILFALALVVVSCVGGSVVALVTSRQRIRAAEQDILNSYTELEKRIKTVTEVAEHISNLPIACQRHWEPLDLSIKAVNMLKSLALREFDKHGGSLVTYDDLAHIEANVPPNGSIWVLTSALQLEEEELKDVIHENLRKGVKYLWFIPRDDGILRLRFIELAVGWQKVCELPPKKAKEQIRCLLVPGHFVYMTVIIYEPYSVPPTVLVKFPTSRIYEKEKYPLIYRVDTQPQEAWRTFLNSFQELIDGKCSDTKYLEIPFLKNGAPKD